jgi:hypothetical protein
VRAPGLLYLKAWFEPVDSGAEVEHAKYSRRLLALYPGCGDTANVAQYANTESSHNVRKRNAGDIEHMIDLKSEYERWQGTTLAETLERSPERAASFTTDSGIPVKALYTPLDLEGSEYL